MKTPWLFLILLAGCNSVGQADPNCPSGSARAKIGVNYVNALVAACPPAQYQNHLEQCPDYKPLTDKYDAQRAAWVECK